MRHVFLVALFCFIAAEAAHAQNQPPPPQTESAPTRIEVDAESNIIRFFIGGREQAVLDADGLHVNGSIDYSGTITDGNKYSQPATGERDAP